MRIPMRQVFGEALRDAGASYNRLVVLDADVSSSTQTAIFGNAYPDRFFNFGIAEQDMVAAAAGFASNGDIPVVSTFAFLLTLRAGDALRSLIAYNRLNVKLAGGYAGLSDFADGASHQSVTDLSIMRAMPNLTVLSPSDIQSTRGAVNAMLAYDGPVYLRLSRAEVGSLNGGDEPFIIGKARTMRKGEDVLLCAHGPVLENVLEAADALLKEGIRCHVLDYATVKPFDTAPLIEAARAIGRVVTVEESNIIGGLGSAVAETLCEACCAVRFKRLGIADRFGESGSYAQLLKRHGLDSDSIIAAIREILR